MNPVALVPLNTGIYLAALAVVVVTSTVQATVGFGANLLAMPVLVQLDPSLVPGPAIVVVVILNLFVLWRDRTAIHPGPVSIALAGRVVGTGLAVVALGMLSERGLGLVVAVVVLAAVAILSSGLSPPRTTVNMVTAGMLSGFGGTTAGVGGPPVALLFADTSGPEIRGSMAAYFLVGSLMSLFGLWLAGRFGPTEVALGVSLIPGALIGYAISGPLRQVVDRGFTRPAILALSTTAAIILLARLALG